MNKQLFGMLAMSAVLALAPAAQASSVSDNRVVRDTGGAVVHAYSNGSCVRTNWEGGSDVCAPQPMAEMKPAKAQVRTILSTDEKTAYFEFNKATLTEEAKLRLDEVARRLSSASDVQSASIVGFADRIGSSEYNVELSAKRAAAVRDYLASRGYMKTEIAKVQAVGEAQPSTDCAANMPRAKAISCLAPDRKVEVQLKYVDTVKVSAR